MENIQEQSRRFFRAKTHLMVTTWHYEAQVFSPIQRIGSTYLLTFKWGFLACHARFFPRQIPLIDPGGGSARLLP